MTRTVLTPSSSRSFSTKLSMSCEEILLTGTEILSLPPLGAARKRLIWPVRMPSGLLREVGGQRATRRLDLETAALIADTIGFLDRLDAGENPDDDNRRHDRGEIKPCREWLR